MERPISLTEMSLKHQGLDESFDLAFLHCMKSKVFLRMGYHRMPTELLMEFVQILDRAANLYILSTPALMESSKASLQVSSAPPTPVNQNRPSRPDSKAAAASITSENGHLDIIQDLGITLHSTTNTMVPVRRERIAFACLDILFDLCSSGEEPSGSSTGGNSNKDHGGANGIAASTTETEPRKRTARTMTPVLMQRCRVLLDAYTADQALLGKCPFPRLRHQEISLVLRRLNELRLIPGVLISDSEGQSGVRTNDPLLNQQEQKGKQMSCINWRTSCRPRKEERALTQPIDDSPLLQLKSSNRSL